MKHFSEYFLGNHDLAFHLSGLIFTLLGTLIAKYHFWKNHQAQCDGVCVHPKFSLKYWFKNNIEEFTIALITSFVVVRFIDVLLHWLNPKISAAFGWEIPLTEDVAN